MGETGKEPRGQPGGAAPGAAFRDANPPVDSGFLLDIVERAPAAIAVLRGRRHRIVFANAAWRTLAGGGPVLGRTVAELFPEAARDGGLRLLDEALRTGRRISGRALRFVGPDGGESFWDLEHVPLGAFGRSGDLLVLAHEVTGAARARREAEEAQRLLQGLMAYIPEGITIADAPDARVRWVSDYGLRLIGRREEAGDAGAVRPERWRLLHPDGVAPAAAEALPLARAARRGEVVVDEEWLLERPDGSRVPILCNAGPIRDADGTIRWGVLAWRDIAERKRAEEDLADAVRRQTLLVREMSHRVVNGFQMITGLLQLQRRAIADASARAALDMAERRVHAMALAHRQLYRSDTGVGVIDLADYLDGLCADLWRALVEGSGCATLAVDVPAGVRMPTDRAVTIGLLVTELVTNAAKYAFRPGDSGRIDVRFERCAEGARLTVADDGCGLPPDFRPEASKGLGMTIVLAQVRQLDGRLEIDRTAPGARFAVTMPA